MADYVKTKQGNTVTGSKSTYKGYLRMDIYWTLYTKQVVTDVYVYFRSMYAITDTNNSYYFSKDSINATDLVGSKSINHPVSTGGGWDEANITLLEKRTYTIDRQKNSTTVNFAAKFTGIDNLGANNVMTVTESLAIEPLQSYTISYDANGGSGAPPSQTKWYDETVEISYTSPTRAGYAFAGWGTSNTDTTVDYMPGYNYTANSNITLYAIWVANGYTVSYNANGGSGVPSNQVKYHDDNTFILSNVVPTRENYNFKGWAISATATTISYQPGSLYTSNAPITLYAVWELAYTRPRLTITSVDRCDSNSILNDEGTYALIEFDWACDLSGTTIIVESKKSISNVWTTEYSVSNAESSGSTSVVIGNGALASDVTYDIRLTVSDANGMSDKTAILTAKNYPIDVYAEGKGVAFGKPAELEDTLDVDFKGLFRNGLSVMTSRGATVDVGNYADYGYILGNINANTDVTSLSPIPFKMERQFGDCFTVASDGGIKVGAGVNLVRVTACIGGSATGGRGWAYVRIGSNNIIVGSDAISYGSFFTVNLSSIFDVKENDIIYVIAAENMKLYDGGVGCYVYVERIK